MLIIPWNTNSGGFLVPTQAEKFTASGTFTAAKAGYYRVLCVGGGGGGCGRCEINVGGPGGGSGFVLVRLVQLAQDEAVTVTVGAGGAGAVEAVGVLRTGSAGGSTSFGAYLLANGGRGGRHYVTGPGLTTIRGFGGAGGSGGGDHERIGGNDGDSGPGTVGGLGQGLGSFTDLGAAFQFWVLSAGTAGSSPVSNGGGGGGLDVDSDAVTATDGAGAAGSAGSGYGAGGGGSDSANTGIGGSGADGLVLVEGPVINSS